MMWLFNWFVKLFRKKKLDDKPKAEIYGFKFIDDIPDEPKKKILYFIGEHEYFWQFVMLCPCGCDSLLHMNLMEDEDPYWTYHIEDGMVTIVPSIDRKVGCKSHFFVKSGKIIWS